jgi:flagellar biosynthesis protein FliR
MFLPSSYRMSMMVMYKPKFESKQLDKQFDFGLAMRTDFILFFVGLPPLLPPHCCSQASRSHFLFIMLISGLDSFALSHISESFEITNVKQQFVHFEPHSPFYFFIVHMYIVRIYYPL